MAIRTTILAPGEWYHCFTRGVDKRRLFMEERDYERFQMLLYACNSKTPIHISTLGNSHQGPALMKVLEQERGEPLVDIGAYALMPNHPHLLLREIAEGGITSFMQKIGTAYTMFFNKKYNRTGALFSGRFKAKHVATNEYFGRVVNYIHGNPAELFEPRVKEDIIRDEQALRENLLAYRFSSLQDYRESRPETVIVAVAAVQDIVGTNPSFDTILDDIKTFYQE